MGGIAWKRLGLVAALLLAGTGMAQAAPPAVGSSHHFLDPVFRGTIVCDTLDAVQAIAGAEQPDQIYAAYYMTTNAIGEPICMAIAPTALVRAVTPIGVMDKNGKSYDAWAVEAEIDGTVIFALYLEHRLGLLV
ncbi:hypothetical protein [Devosia sp.]|uniref:hypothetical protein n=1 Tax=Devosia sp. TaxID=1871048 RepID=UPI002FC8DB69